MTKEISDGSLIDEFELLINQCSEAFKDDHAWETARNLAYGALNCMGKHTLTGMITASGHQFMDWSSADRLFSSTASMYRGFLTS